jgi:hypothetical protein
VSDAKYKVKVELPNLGVTMMNSRKLFCLVILIPSLCFMSASASAASGQHKPQSPFQISIALAQPGLATETIKAGDVLDLKVVAISMLDATEMRISVELIDGAELVAGDLSWAGRAGKKEEKQLLFSVRVPATGIGKIRASLTVSTGGTKPLSRVTQYLLLTGEQQRQQREEQNKLKKSNPARKDSRGKDVIEYR